MKSDSGTPRAAPPPQGRLGGPGGFAPRTPQAWPFLGGWGSFSPPPPVGPSWLVVQFWCSWVCEVLVEPRVPRVCGRFCLTAVAQWTAPRTLRRPTSHARHSARGLQALLQRGPQIFASGPRNFFRAPKKFSQRTLEIFAEDPPKNCPPGRIVGKSYYKMCPFCPKSCVPKGYKLPPKKLPRAQYFLPGGPI